MKTNTLSTKTYLNPWSKQNFYVLDIDGKSLEEIVLDHHPEIRRGLVPTLLNWLDDPEERQLVWSRVLPSNGQKENLPILMCSEDIDLWCTLIIVEVEADKSYVYWRRVGLENSAAGMPQEIGSNVNWFSNIPSMIFEKTQYESILEEFRLRLNDEIAYSAKEHEVISAYDLFNETHNGSSLT